MFILVIHIIVSLVLVVVILLQAGRGGGLAETFGGGGSQVTIFGQRASSFLTKATTISAVLFLCTALSLAFISSRGEKSLMDGAKVIPPAKVEPAKSEPVKTEDKQAAADIQKEPPAQKKSIPAEPEK